MTARPKVGDRVRVVVEGETSVVTDNGFFVGRAWIAPNDDPAVSFTVLRPPVKVGDVIETAEELDALPIDAVVLSGSHWAWQQFEDGWEAVGTTPAARPSFPATVLYLPDGAA